MDINKHTKLIIRLCITVKLITVLQCAYYIVYQKYFSLICSIIVFACWHFNQLVWSGAFKEKFNGYKK